MPLRTLAPTYPGFRWVSLERVALYTPICRCSVAAAPLSTCKGGRQTGRTEQLLTEASAEPTDCSGDAEMSRIEVRGQVLSCPHIDQSQNGMTCQKLEGQGNPSTKGNSKWEIEHTSPNLASTPCPTRLLPIFPVATGNWSVLLRPVVRNEYRGLTTISVWGDGPVSETWASSFLSGQ